MENRDNSKLISELSENGMAIITPHGGSMLPFITGKERVLIIKKDGRLEKLTPALYVRPDGTYVLHRVIEIGEDGYYFVGDNTVEREFVSENNVLGIATGYYKKDKFIDFNTKKYIKRVKKHYKSEKHRLKRMRQLKKYYKIKTKIYRILKGKHV